MQPFRRKSEIANGISRNETHHMMPQNNNVPKLMNPPNVLVPAQARSTGICASSIAWDAFPNRTSTLHRIGCDNHPATASCNKEILSAVCSILMSSRVFKENALAGFTRWQTSLTLPTCYQASALPSVPRNAPQVCTKPNQTSFQTLGVASSIEHLSRATFGTPKRKLDDDENLGSSKRSKSLSWEAVISTPPTASHAPDLCKPTMRAKEEDLCMHGRRGGCMECSGSTICMHNRRRSRCKDCGGSGICQHGRQRNYCKECGGSGICEHNRKRSLCKECGGSSICVHGRQRSRCRDCGGSQICEHNRRRSLCKECGGSQICVHQRQRSLCKDCGGSQICVHRRRKGQCKECAALRLQAVATGKEVVATGKETIATIREEE